MVVLAIPVSAQDYLIVGEQGVVSNTNGDGVNIRSEPSLDSGIHFVAEEGTPLEVTSGPEEAAGNTWYGVHINGTDAWIVTDYVTSHPVVTGSQVQVVQTDGHGLRLRSDASLDAETLTVIPEGTVLDVVGEERSGWANVSYNGHTGFAHGDYLAVVADGGSAGTQQTATEESEPDPEPEPASADNNGVAVGSNVQIINTNGDGLNIRHGAGYHNGVMAVAAEGDVMYVLDGPEIDSDGVSWWNVEYKGQAGWTHGDYIQVTDQEVTAAGSVSIAADNGSDEGDAALPASGVGEQIVSEAMQFLGYPYVWGGTTPSGFDCSGFMYYVVNQITGGGFPRLLESQVNRGTHVPADQLQPGDLVFQQNTYRWGLSHAGIYIGNGQFIHASTPGSGVIISDLWDSYWGQRYYTARRIS